MKKPQIILTMLSCLIIAGCQTKPNSDMPLKTLSGGVVDLRDVPAIGLVRKDGASSAYVKRAFFAVPRNELCPWQWSYGPTPSTTSVCSNNVEKFFPGIEEHIDGGCDCIVAFTPNHELKVSENDYLSPYRHGPVTLLVENKSGDRKYIKGSIEFEKNGLGKQSVTIFNSTGAKACAGTVNFKLLGDGAFDLACFGNSVNATGVVALKNINKKDNHSIGSGLFSNGDKFAFVTLTAPLAKEKYPEYFSQL